MVGAKFVHIPEEMARKLYVVHRDKPFIEGLVKFTSSSPSLIMVWEAEGIIKIIREMIGATFGRDSKSGTIRGDFSCAKRYNLIHGSDSPKSARYEIDLFFKPEEIIDYELTNSLWIYGIND